MDEQPPQSLTLLSAPSPSGHPWLASRLLQRQVVNVSTIEPLGRVEDVLFDPINCQLAGVIVHREPAPRGVGAAIGRIFGQKGDSGVVSLDHVISLNGDVVTVNADPVGLNMASAFEGMLSLNDVCEFVILTTFGMSLGSLMDMLLDHSGSAIMGYVVKPSELAQASLPQLADLVGFDDSGAEDPDEDPDVVDVAPQAPALPAPHLRVIPASSRVHFGESLIMLVSEVEPLQRRVVVVSQPRDQQTDSASTLRQLKKKWLPS
jgi:sporulation protein YlmC with PRC-barrel domain